MDLSLWYLIYLFHFFEVLQSGHNLEESYYSPLNLSTYSSTPSIVSGSSFLAPGFLHVNCSGL